MDPISIIVILLIIGVCLYLIQRFVPLDDSIKTIINVVIVLFVVIWLLRLFGVAASTVPYHR